MIYIENQYNYLGSIILSFLINIPIIHQISTKYEYQFYFDFDINSNPNLRRTELHGSRELEWSQWGYKTHSVDQNGTATSFSLAMGFAMPDPIEVAICNETMGYLQKV